jgi:lipopolysaccharide biosynthesis glycosyltransferase
MFRIFIGYDPREHEAAEVCRHSLLKHSTLPVQITFLKTSELREQGIYDREDAEGTTDYTLTRFLVPYLSQYQGYSLYVDGDFVFLSDVRALFQELDGTSAVQVAKQQYKPKSATKKVDQPQSQYTKKNWSSLMLFRCDHSSCMKLTPDAVNKKAPKHFHQFEWVESASMIGHIDKQWNWLVNWNNEPDDGEPRALHFTEGGPWLPAYRKTTYGWHYNEYLNQWKDSQITPPSPGQFDNLPPDMERLFRDLMVYRVDPNHEYHDVTKESIDMSIMNLDNKAVMAVEAETADEINESHRAKGQNYDPFLKSFIMGSGGQITVWDKVVQSRAPVVVRGVTKRKVMNTCREQNRDFYYIDTGYFGNGRKKLYHRITKNNMQYVGPVIHRPRDRLAQAGIGPRKFRPGRNILLAPPSQKLLMCYDIDLERWLEDTINLIKLYTDRDIVVRNKASRSVRQSSDTMEMALERDVHCLVTFSSIAAVEAVLLGKPAITLGPSAAWPVTSQNIKDIEKPFIPSLDEVEEWAAHLAYCQFTEAEMRDGTAWRILNDQ